MHVVNVLLFRNVPKAYSYLLDSELSAFVGSHVELPLGRSMAKGLIVSKAPLKENAAESKSNSLKSVLSVDSSLPVLSEEIIALILWLSEHYQLSPYKAYQTVCGKLKERDIPEQEADEISQSPFTLTAEQEQVLSSLKETLAISATHLIQGVTSSGKTEVYMRLTETVLNQGKSSIIMLPEIALTPQTFTRFSERFGNRVSVVHSGLTPKQRQIEWCRAAKGDAQVIIGPRSAVFSPVKDLGLIVLDEEQEQSYKQDQHPRYDAHEVAAFRSQHLSIPVVLGSATPRLDSRYQASKESTLHRMTTRTASAELPKVHIIDMQEAREQSGFSQLSPPLLEAMKDRLEKKEQTLLLLNRRGFSSFIVCESCANVHGCSQCGLSFTYHKDGQFRCHRCDITTTATPRCHHCKKPLLRFSGVGTQKLEMEVCRAFPSAKVIRMDSDSVKTAKDMDACLSEFAESGDVLIGTQMIAKGHDFEKVTLVGVLGVDTVLNMPDYRSSERCFQLLTQVAGRAGRSSRKGEVFVQSYQSEHYVMQHVEGHDFDGFYEEELAFREALSYPPFSKLIYIIISSKSPSMINSYCNQLAPFIKDLESDGVQIIGPKPAPIEKIREYSRWDILLKCEPSCFLEIKERMRELPTAPRSLRVFVDFSPLSLL